jgi:hypothetical protein
VAAAVAVGLADDLVRGGDGGVDLRRGARRARRALPSAPIVAVGPACAVRGLACFWLVELSYPAPPVLWAPATGAAVSRASMDSTHVSTGNPRKAISSFVGLRS